jgi:hypothetical protein
MAENVTIPALSLITNTTTPTPTPAPPAAAAPVQQPISFFAPWEGLLSPGFITAAVLIFLMIIFAVLIYAYIARRASGGGGIPREIRDAVTGLRDADLVAIVIDPGSNSVKIRGMKRLGNIYVSTTSPELKLLISNPTAPIYSFYGKPCAIGMEISGFLIPSAPSEDAVIELALNSNGEQIKGLWDVMVKLASSEAKITGKLRVGAGEELAITIPRSRVMETFKRALLASSASTFQSMINILTTIIAEGEKLELSRALAKRWESEKIVRLAQILVVGGIVAMIIIIFLLLQRGF